MNELLQVTGLHKEFKTNGGVLTAVNDVAFTIARGEILALVGESGSGKTTAGRLILRLLDATAGKVKFDGHDLMAMPARELKRFRKRLQPIFQDPFASLNPYMRIGTALEEAALTHFPKLTRLEREERVRETLTLVGLSPTCGHRYPHEFSGGQRQRIGIARALMVEPELIVADEAVSALDVSIQAQIINLIELLREKLGLTLLFVAHDLAVVRHIADRVAVMYLGRIVEIGPTEQLFSRPAHPYTQALLSASPIPEPGRGAQRIMLSGEIPSPLNPPSGCAFRTRCRHAVKSCAELAPVLSSYGESHQVACIRTAEL